MEPLIPELNPEENGRKRRSGSWEPLWYDGPQLPSNKMFVQKPEPEEERNFSGDDTSDCDSSEFNETEYVIDTEIY